MLKNENYLKKVLFICLGNICRSPAAEGILKKYIHDENLDSTIFVDSAGLINYHQGELPFPLMIKTAESRGYNLDHICRPFVPKKDYVEFDYIIIMDYNNFEILKQKELFSKYKNKIHFAKDFLTRHNVSLVPDPYYGTTEDFYYVIELLEDACSGLLIKIKEDMHNEHSTKN